MTGKEIFKISCCAAIGWYVGKDIFRALDSLERAVFITLAEHDNQFAKNVCEKANINYQKNEETYEDKIIGFHM